MKKRTISMILAMSMTAACLAGCGSKTQSTADSADQAAAGAKGINFVYADKNALHGVIKRRFSKIIEPDANQQADAYDIFYRAHHDLIIGANEAAGVYVHAAKA